MIGWTSVLFAIQSYLAETPEQKETSSTPGYFGVLMSFMAVGVAYMPLFLPPPGGRGGGVGTGTEAAGAVPQ
ncbi:hypothetical protein LTS18_011843 [Coniosporium uncinatum]|uniref:Uncharacterized protein n=2 Tax=Coniosporium uncinatum TaxID=93489 RepID=A0ACC3DJW5_9PEZI|nr:hypothetical protein LTS18_014404 [Coniosporium uncinatum]KAK3076844.1 hypothetical protein LTS18_011843 [Coniosporium uncinatum]